MFKNPITFSRITKVRYKWIRTLQWILRNAIRKDIQISCKILEWPNVCKLPSDEINLYPLACRKKVTPAAPSGTDCIPTDITWRKCQKFVRNFSLLQQFWTSAAGQFLWNMSKYFARKIKIPLTFMIISDHGIFKRICNSRPCVSKIR